MSHDSPWSHCPSPSPHHLLATRATASRAEIVCVSILRSDYTSLSTHVDTQGSSAARYWKPGMGSTGAYLNVLCGVRTG